MNNKFYHVSLSDFNDNDITKKQFLDDGKRLYYQSHQFTCKKCGITFEVYSDSAILSQQFCNECAKK